MRSTRSRVGGTTGSPSVAPRSKSISIGSSSRTLLTVAITVPPFCHLSVASVQASGKKTLRPSFHLPRRMHHLSDRSQVVGARRAVPLFVMHSATRQSGQADITFLLPNQRQRE